MTGPIWRRTRFSLRPASDFLRGRSSRGPVPGRRWKVWDLDSELRYESVLTHLPNSPLPVLEVGSGPRGLAGWTDRHVIGIDPGDDQRHGEVVQPPNLQRLTGDGAKIPLPSDAVCAAVAVDTLEHVPRAHRGEVVSEMIRVTCPGGNVIITGPAGPAATAGDRRLRERLLADYPESPLIVWLDEHVRHGLPTVPELVSYFEGQPVSRIDVQGSFNLRMWWTVHRAAMGDFPLQHGLDYLHHLIWGPFAFLARRLRRGPFYRYVVIARVVPQRRDATWP